MDRTKDFKEVILDTKNHREKHRFLHQCLDELVADMIYHTKDLPSKTTVMQLMEWSNKQTKRPDKE